MNASFFLFTLSTMAVRTCVKRAIDSVLDGYRPNVLSLDTETTGCGPGDVAVQVALVELNPHREVVHTLNGYLHPPDGVEMKPGAQAVHNISMEYLREHGEPDVTSFLNKVVDRIAEARADGRVVVAHNSSFDVAMLNRTLQAHGLNRRLKDGEVECTMQKSKRICNLKNKLGRPKPPKNEELFRFLHGRDPSEVEGPLHDACTDATITALSYLEGRTRGWW